jgi:hypothetical protein
LAERFFRFIGVPCICATAKNEIPSAINAGKMKEDLWDARNREKKSAIYLITNENDYTRYYSTTDSICQIIYYFCQDKVGLKPYYFILFVIFLSSSASVALLYSYLNPETDAQLALSLM